MNRDKYEAKKALLKRVKGEWSNRLREARTPHFVGPRQWPISNLSYGDLIAYYLEAQQKLRNFIHRSIDNHERDHHGYKRRQAFLKEQGIEGL